MDNAPVAGPSSTTAQASQQPIVPVFKDNSRFYCPYPDCNRSFAELWRLKVHYRAPPDVRGSGKERGHGSELTICPKCMTQLQPGRHHVGCTFSKATLSRQTSKKSLGQLESSRVGNSGAQQQQQQQEQQAKQEPEQQRLQAPPAANLLPQQLVASIMQQQGGSDPYQQSLGPRKSSFPILETFLHAPGPGPGTLQQPQQVGADFGGYTLVPPGQAHLLPVQLCMPGQPGQQLGTVMTVLPAPHSQGGQQGEGGGYEDAVYAQHADPHGTPNGTVSLSGLLPAMQLQGSMFNFSQFISRMPAGTQLTPQQVQQLQQQHIQAQQQAQAQHHQHYQQMQQQQGQQLVQQSSNSGAHDDGDLMHLLFGSPDQHAFSGRAPPPAAPGDAHGSSNNTKVTAVAYQVKEEGGPWGTQRGGGSLDGDRPLKRQHMQAPQHALGAFPVAARQNGSAVS